MTCPICQGDHSTAGTLCPRCLNRIRRDLHTIVAAWESSAAGPITTTGEGTGDRPLPGGTEWLDWRAGNQLRKQLTGWIALWGAQDPTLPQPADRRLETLLAWLQAHLDGTGQHTTTIGTFSTNIHQWAQTAQRITGHTPTGQIVLCPGTVEPCGRRLRINLHQPDQTITCRQCGTDWTAARLLFHGVTGTTDAWADAEAIQAVTGIPARTIRHWAQTGRIQRRHSRYLIAEVYQQRTTQ